MEILENPPDAVFTGLSYTYVHEYPNLFYVLSFQKQLGISKTLTSDLTIEFVPNRYKGIPELCHVGVRRGESFHRCDYPGILASKAKDTRSQRPDRKLKLLINIRVYKIQCFYLSSANYSVRTSLHPTVVEVFQNRSLDEWCCCCGSCCCCWICGDDDNFTVFAV